MSDNIYTPEQQQQMADFFRSMKDIVDTTDPLVQANKEAAAAAKAYADHMKEQWEKGGKSLGGFGKSLIDGKQGFEKYGEAVEQGTQAVGSMAAAMISAATGIPMLGQAVGAAVSFIGKSVRASLKQNDQLYKSYQDLAMMGDVTIGGMTQLQQQLAGLGLTSEEAGKFKELVTKYAPQLAVAEGSLASGVKEFADVAKEVSRGGGKMTRDLLNAGESIESLSDATGFYLQQQTKLGLYSSKSEQQKIKETFEYVQILKELSEIQGISRDEAQKQIDSQKNDYRWQRELAGMGEQEQIRAQEFMSVMGGISKETQDMAIDLKVNRFMRRQENVALSQSVGNFKEIYQKAVVEGSMSMQEAQRQVTAGITKQAEKYKNTGNLYTNGIAGVTLGNQALVKAYEIQGNASKKLSDAQDKRADADNTQVEENARNEQKAASQRETIESIKNKVSKELIDTTTGQIGVIHRLGQSFREMGDWINHFFGGSSSMADDAKTAEDKIKENREKINDAEEERLKNEIKAAKFQEMVAVHHGNVKDILSDLEDERKLKELSNVITGSVESRRAADLELKATYELIKQLKTLNTNITEETEQKSVFEIQQENAKIEAAKRELEKQNRIMKNGGNTGNTGNTSSGSSSSSGGGGGGGTGGRRNSADTGAITDATKAAIAKMQELYPGGRVTSTTGGRHQDPAHPMGMAFDYVLPDDIAPKNKQEADAIAAKLKDQLGARKVLEEYFTQTKYGTGKHMHIDIGAANGGLISGPKSGYPFLGHGTELVIPGADKLKEFKGASKEPLSSIFGGSSNSEMVDLLSELNGKMDTFIYALESNNNIQENILRHMKV